MHWQSTQNWFAIHKETLIDVLVSPALNHPLTSTYFRATTKGGITHSSILRVEYAALYERNAEMNTNKSETTRRIKG
jgi:hypothetical protein